MDLNDGPIPKGKRIRLDAMGHDPDPIPPGATGVVTGGYGNPGDPTAQVWVEWDPPNDHRSLSLVLDQDRFTIIGDAHE